MDDRQRLLEYSCFSFLTVIICFGTIGNFISLIIWSRGENSRSLACSTYFKLISMSDICVLLIAGVYELLRFYPVKYIISEYNTFACKSITFGRLFTTQISTWLVVLVTIERTLSVLFPLKHHTGGARKRAIFSGLLILVLAFSFNSVFLVAMEAQEDFKVLNQDGDNMTSPTSNKVPFYTNWFDGSKDSSTGSFARNLTKCYESIKTSQTEEERRSTRPLNQSMVDRGNIKQGLTTEFKQMTNGSYNKVRCDILNRTLENSTIRQNRNYIKSCDFLNLSRTVEDIAWLINYVSLICCMPLTIILICNTIILVKYCIASQPRNSKSPKRAKGVVVLTRMVLAIGLVYTLSTFPMTLFVLTHFDLLNVEFKIWDIEFLSEIARTLFCLNNAANFILYFSTGEKFRKDFKHLFGNLFKRC